MSAIKPNSLSKFAGMLSIAPVATPTNFSRLASVVGLAGNLEISDPVEIRAQDTGLVASFADLKAYATGKFLEVFDLELVKMLFGGTKIDTAAATQNISNEEIADWTPGKAIFLQNKNADKTAVENVVVKADGSDLTVDTDYKIISNSDGETGILPITAQTGAITVDYDFTPNANEKLSIKAGNYEVPSFVVKIETLPDETGKSRVIILEKAKFEGSFKFNFADISEAKELEGADFTFNGEKNSEIIFYDEKL